MCIFSWQKYRLYKTSCSELAIDDASVGLFLVVVEDLS